MATFLFFSYTSKNHFWLYKTKFWEDELIKSQIYAELRLIYNLHGMFIKKKSNFVWSAGPGSKTLFLWIQFIMTNDHIGNIKKGPLIFQSQAFDVSETKDFHSLKVANIIYGEIRYKKYSHLRVGKIIRLTTLKISSSCFLISCNCFYLLGLTLIIWPHTCK